ncbi:unnamed protein product [Colias eurytheme]|nr:unnamed protein product [Colias eurytheme]
MWSSRTNESYIALTGHYLTEDLEFKSTLIGHRCRSWGIDRENASNTELPCFNGAPGEWLPFKAAFVETNAQYKFTASENIARFRSCLKREARQAVSALLFTVNNPDVILKTLEQCFGRPEVIIDNALEDIKRLPRLGNTLNEINQFAIKLQNIVTIISCLDERGYFQNPMLARTGIDKLSPHMRSRWCDYAEDNGNYAEPEITTLSRFLMREADRSLRHTFASSGLAVGGRNINRYNETVQRSERKPMKSKHRRFRCKAKRCGIEECREGHHALLHLKENRNSECDTEKREDVAVHTASVHNTTAFNKVLLKVCPFTVRGASGEEIDTYALLDEVSTVTLIDSGPKYPDIHRKKYPDTDSITIRIKRII